MTRYYSGPEKNDFECCLKEALHYLPRMSGYQGAAQEEGRAAITPSCHQHAALGCNVISALAVRGFAEHVASISLSSQEKPSSPPSFQGTAGDGIWSKGTGGHCGQLGVLCTASRHSGLGAFRSPLHKSASGSALLQVAWPPTAPCFRAKLTIHFPRSFATVWNGAVSQTS